jgi:hypothetical protein
MRRSALIAAVTLVAALAVAAPAVGAAVLTHAGAHYYSRTIPKGCFANRPTIHPHRLALGCNCPRGETVQRAPSAVYRFRLRVNHPFVYEVAWQTHMPHITTTQAGPWSYVKITGPRRCGTLTQVIRVTIVPR